MVTPLTMSQTKDDLLKHLNMSPETYNLMAKEADSVYKWLTSGKQHLKKNCKRNPPYDWSDIVEKSKDEAMVILAQSGNEYTDYYWKLAEPTDDCPNWIARWFLYHKFRYRDGRNKGKEERKKNKHAHAASSSGASSAGSPAYTTGTGYDGYSYAPSATSSYQYGSYTQYRYQYSSESDASASNMFYDPVRAEWVEK